MADKIIGIITENESDILKILRYNGLKLHIMKPGSISEDELDGCSSIAILAGTESEPLLFQPRERLIIEKQIKKGKKVFSEFCSSIGYVYSQEPTSTRFDRLCFCNGSIALEGVTPGDLLDDQCNTRIKPWDITCSVKKPLLQYVKVNAHSNTGITEKLTEKVDERAIWFDEPENLLICVFRISNFIKARFTPAKRWKSVIRFILEWLCEEKINVENIENAYYLCQFDSEIPVEDQVKTCVDLGINWFGRSGLLLHEGKKGIKEGIATEIYPDGSQRILSAIRHDCIGEVSFSYFLRFLLYGDTSNLMVSKNLSSFCFEFMQVKEVGPFKGMMRWTNQAWGVCYQDDVARTLIPELLKCLYTNEKVYLNECVEALKFLARTTGTDGMRVMRTDMKDMNDEMLKKLSSQPGNYPSAHYNAYYLASLLLAYKQTGNEEFKKTGIKGMETIMSVYPETIREHSETQELCRLILPLAFLYWVTKENKHKKWLYEVTNNLQWFRHTSGGYLEWDTDYKSARFGKSGDECSLLTKNGDPVVDLLYSLNWLPMAFIQAYMITGDLYFKNLWEEISKFMISTQLHSGNRQINGGWARAMDVELMEVFALPNDLGWGPWAIETGWTVAEILSGLMTGLLSEELKKYYIN